MKSMTLFFVLLGALGCVSDAPYSRSKVIADLSPCPNSPNCISSRSKDSRHAMPPLPYLKSGLESMEMENSHGTEMPMFPFGSGLVGVHWLQLPESKMEDLATVAGIFTILRPT